jgi:hypothetical protein
MRVIVELEASLEDLYMGGSLKVSDHSWKVQVEVPLNGGRARLLRRDNGLLLVVLDPVRGAAVTKKKAEAASAEAAARAEAEVSKASLPRSALPRILISW